MTDAAGMTPRIHVITLGVGDLQRALTFYRDGLGLPSPGITGTQFAGDEEHPAGAVAMFRLADGLTLALYPRSELAKDAHVGSEMTTGSGVSIGHIVDSRAEVDRVLDLARQAGGQVLGPAHERPWGIYSGYFSDPDGHLWEILHVLPD
ncbi:MAG TPA: VOC family protein [Solirubrobacteraceae bacterium]|nr:VOC family protein [Solirubrobacteraceae bacterium]